jgi:hypothetical protein
MAANSQGCRAAAIENAIEPNMKRLVVHSLNYGDSRANRQRRKLELARGTTHPGGFI